MSAHQELLNRVKRLESRIKALEEELQRAPTSNSWLENVGVFANDPVAMEADRIQREMYERERARDIAKVMRETRRGKTTRKRRKAVPAGSCNGRA